MKFRNLIFLIFVFFQSCDFISKHTSSQAPVTDTVLQNTPALVDKHGCAVSSGYKWSTLNQKCLRPVEEGFRLNPVAEKKNLEPQKSAYLIFSTDKLTAEVFFPSQSQGVVFNQKSENYHYKNLVLITQPQFRILRNDTLVYIAAQTVDKAVIEPDKDIEN